MTTSPHSRAAARAAARSATASRPSTRQPAAAATLIGALLAATGLQARAAEPLAYALDPVHTRLMFSIDHAGFSKAIGTVSGSTGTLRFDPDDWRAATLDVRVPLARLDLGDPKWNAAALARNLLDGETHPEARFVSTHVEPVDSANARVCGELSLRGMTRPLCMDVTLNQVKRYPLPPFRRTAGFSATATLSRSAFGIDAWSSLIGDQVELRIEAEAVRDRGAEVDPPAAPAMPEVEPLVPAPVEPLPVEPPAVESGQFTPPDPAGLR